MLISSYLKLHFVNDLLVRPVRNAEWCENITKGKTSELIKSLNLSILVGIQMIEDIVKALSEWSSGNILDSIEHPHSVTVVDEPITEDS
jgi:hypothetical protein